MVTPPTGRSLQRLAEQSWDRLGARSTLHYEDARWTGDQLAERVRRVAGGLVEAGLLPGQRVLVCMANCPEVRITYAAVWRAGVVATPVLFLLSEDHRRPAWTGNGGEDQPRRPVGGGGGGHRHVLRRIADLGPAPAAALPCLRADGQRDEPARAWPGNLGADALVRPGRLAAARAAAPDQRQPARAVDAADAPAAAAGGLRPVGPGPPPQRHPAAARAGWGGPPP